MKKGKLKKSVWLPLGLALYGACMTLYFGPRLIAEGRGAKLWVSVAFEVILIIGLFFALRRKEKLSDKWKEK